MRIVEGSTWKHGGATLLAHWILLLSRLLDDTSLVRSLNYAKTAAMCARGRCSVYGTLLEGIRLYTCKDSS